MTTETQNASATSAPTTEQASTEKLTPQDRMIQFIQAWESSDSVAQAAKKLGLKPSTVQQKATTYRNEHGLALKKMRGGAKLDINAAQAELAKLRNVSVEKVQAEGQTILKATEQRRAEREAQKEASDSAN